jgi:hypothetical protein
MLQHCVWHEMMEVQRLISYVKHCIFTSFRKVETVIELFSCSRRLIITTQSCNYNSNNLSVHLSCGLSCLSTHFSCVTFTVIVVLLFNLDFLYLQFLLITVTERFFDVYVRSWFNVICQLVSSNYSMCLCSTAQMHQIGHAPCVTASFYDFLCIVR